MYLSQEAKTISTTLRMKSHLIKPGIRTAFQNSIVGCGSEIAFLHNLNKELTTFFQTIRIPNLTFGVRTAVIHHKPMVSFGKKNCELGDMLVVVKYKLATGIEAKSIIYQAKLSRRGSMICDIDSTQLELLTKWPQFVFGRNVQGTAVPFNLQSRSVEFGSYLLMQRNAVSKQFLKAYNNAYGIAPPALLVEQAGPGTIDLARWIYCRGDATNFFSHLVFEIGEHHTTPQLQLLVDALYRFAGLAPDPPDEFSDFQKESEDDGFSIIEITVTPG